MIISANQKTSIVRNHLVEVKPFTAVNAQDLVRFIANHNKGMLYYSQKYRRLLEKVTGGTADYQVVLEDGTITGFLPAFYLDGRLGRVWNSLPWFGSHGGPICTSKIAEKVLLKWWNTEISKPGVAAGTLISNPFYALDTALIQHDYTDVRTGQFTPLPAPQSDVDIEKSLMDSFHSKTRNMIRKAGRQNVKIRIQNNAFDFVEKVHKENMAVIGGAAKSRAYFKAIANDFMPGIDYKIYIANINGEDVAATLLLYQNGIVEYFTPVVKAEWRSAQPLSLLIYRAMIDAAKSGYRLWNWGGTWKSQEGVHRFKKRWGTNDKDYQYFTKVNNEKVFTYTASKLLEMYPSFYVVPFDVLNSGGADNAK